MTNHNENDTVVVQANPSVLVKFMENSTGNKMDVYSEYIDNAIWHGEADNIHVKSKKNLVSVRDDGKGMSKQKFKDSLIFGHRDALSLMSSGPDKFGVGNYSGFFFGDKITFETSKEGNNKKYSVTVKKEDLMETESDSDASGVGFDIKEEEADEDISFTRVTIEGNLNSHRYSTIKTLRKNIAIRYRPFIEDGGNIKVNSKEVDIERDLEKQQNKVDGSDFTIEKEFEGNPVKVKGYVSEEGKEHSSGLHIFWNGRLVVEHEKGDLGLSHTSYRRLRGRIELDHLNVGTQKHDFKKDQTYEDTMKWFQNEIKSEISNKMDEYTPDKEDEEDEEQEDDINDTKLDNLGRAVTHSLKDAFDRDERKYRRALDDEDQDDEEKVEHEQRDTQKKKEGTSGSNKGFQDKKDWNNKARGPRPVIYLGGQKHQIKAEFDDLGENESRFVSKVEEKEGDEADVMEVTINKSNPATRNFRPETYSLTCLIDAVVDASYDPEEHESLADFRENIWRKVNGDNTTSEIVS